MFKVFNKIKKYIAFLHLYIKKKPVYYSFVTIYRNKEQFERYIQQNRKININNTQIEEYDELSNVWSYISSIYNFIPLLKHLLKECKIQNNLAIDIACGTGVSTYYSAKIFKSVIAFDKNHKMLNKARENLIKFSNISYYNNNFINYEFPNNVSFISCTNDSINYILELKDLNRLIRKISNALVKNGIFIFDVINKDFFKRFSGITNHYIIDHKNYYQVFGNLSDNRICKSTFISDNGTEVHTQKYFSNDEINEILHINGIVTLFSCNNGTHEIFIQKKDNELKSQRHINKYCIFVSASVVNFGFFGAFSV